jgi:hypothetical protein
MGFSVGSRQKGFPEYKMGAEHRAKIANSQILKNLIEAAEGTREITPIQAQVGIALLKKVMPDLSTTEHTGETTLVIQQVTRTIVEPPRIVDAGNSRAA